MEITLHQAKEDDIDLIIDLAKKIWLPTYAEINSEEQNSYMFKIWYSSDGIKNQMNEGQQFYLAKYKDDIVGYLSFSKINDNEYKLNKIYLLQELHGKGLGKAMLKLVEEIVSNLSAKYLTLNVNRNNKASVFYLSQNYKVVSQVDIPFGEYWMNDFVMRKEL